MSTRLTAITSHSPEETVSLGAEIARQLVGGEIVQLTGHIGSGKSVLAWGIGQGLGVSRWRGSPTFTLINEYDVRPRMYHVDLYRLSEDEVPDLGLDEYATANSVLVIEWADRAQPYLTRLGTSRSIAIDLSMVDHQSRQLTISCGPVTGEAAIESVS